VPSRPASEAPGAKGRGISSRGLEPVEVGECDSRLRISSHTFAGTWATLRAVAQVFLSSYWALSPEFSDSGLFIFRTRGRRGGSESLGELARRTASFG